MAVTATTNIAARMPAFGAQVAPELVALAESWRRTLVAENASYETIRAYWKVMRLFGAYLAQQGMPQRVEAIAREHVESYIAELLATRAAWTAVSHFRVLRNFFNWCVHEADELQRSPMERMKAPRAEDVPPTVLSEEQVRRVLRTCEGSKDWRDRRDLAALSVLLDCGLRRTELANIRLEDIDWNVNVVTVVGKGNRVRSIAFGRKTARALDGWLRARSKLRDAELPWLWISRQGRLSDDGLYLMVRRRARAAGLGDVWPHLFRHTFAHRWLADGGSEKGLMQLAGWRSRTMLDRYGASAASERAIEEHRQHSPLDTLTDGTGGGRGRRG